VPKQIAETTNLFPLIGGKCLCVPTEFFGRLADAAEAAFDCRSPVTSDDELARQMVKSAT
jgi:hypothetical protein